jgi:hypothetical protein
MENLICNAKNCSQVLQEESFIYSCGHIICALHLDKENTCPVCLRPGDFLTLDFSKNSNEPLKILRMIGSSHKEILSSISCALEYWNFQQSFNFYKIISEKDQKIAMLEEKVQVLKNENDDLAQKIESFNRGLNSKLVKDETPLLFCPPSNRKLKKNL